MTCKIVKKCDHDSLVFCSCCNRVKCKDCDAIWTKDYGSYNFKPYYPYYPWTLTSDTTNAPNFSITPTSMTNCKIGS
jgi:hypothetical protein